jgi:hypothetical protein
VRDEFGRRVHQRLAGVEVVADEVEVVRRVDDLGPQRLALCLAGPQQRAEERRFPAPGVPEEENSRRVRVEWGIGGCGHVEQCSRDASLRFGQKNGEFHLVPDRPH